MDVIKKNKVIKASKVAIPVLFALGLFASNSVLAAGFTAAPPVGNLGNVIVDPYGNSPLTAVIGLQGKEISNVIVTVQGKGDKGVTISYPVGKQALLDNDGIPVFGLYQRHDNKVTVAYTESGKKFNDEYVIKTGAINNKYMDNRSLTELQETKVIKVAPGFEKRLYMVNTHTTPPLGSDLHWAGDKLADANILDPNPAFGSLTFNAVPMTFIVDTEGEYRWWLDQDAVYNGHKYDADMRGYLMGIHQNDSGDFTAAQGQNWMTFNVMGKIGKKIKLPRGYLDASHETRNTPQGTVLLRVGKRSYVRDDGKVVHTVRDQIIEVDQNGNLLDAWDLNTIADPLRDVLLGSLDLGAVCVNIDIKNAGKTAKLEPDTPYGDALGVGPGRNWAHINSIDYDAKDDSIILSFRHQGVMKVGRDKQIKWILSPKAGWEGKMADKVLTPVDKSGKEIKCTDKGLCEGDFDFSYTQHTAWLSSKGTLTVFDNGDGRHYDQPALPDMKYSRFVEYKIDEKKGTVQQLWEYGKERGYDWYSPITSVVEYEADKDTMFGFGGSINLFSPGERTIGKINEIDYKTKDVKVEIDVLSDKSNMTHYRALIVNPETLFNQ